MVSGTFQIHNLENKGHQKLCMKVLVHHCKCMYLNYYCHTSKTTADCTIDAFDTIDLNVNITISILVVSVLSIKCWKVMKYFSLT